MTSESGKIILMRYYIKEQELDVYLNGDLIQTFDNANELPYKIINMLEKLGYSNFEKQMYKSR